MTHETRQITSVIDVRVRNDDRVNRSSIKRRFLPIAIAQFVAALE